VKDITGLRSGKLVAQNPTTLDKHRNWQWLCVCDCGGTKEVRSSLLVKQKVKTCGCSGKSSAKLEKGLSGLNELFWRYQYQATNRGLEFSLTKEFFTLLTTLPCHYCKTPPKNLFKNYTYSGVDRKDNSLGYTENNVVPCCTICNRAKNNMSYDEFVSWISFIKENKEC